MKAVGIIAEYNPFHSGHAYHIAKTREITGCDAVVCLMSGDYVQRGSAAITDKYTRAGMAVKGGADLVIELPVLFSLSASEIFARGAVDILTGITGISYLSFGAEKCDLTALNKAAALFLFEPDEYKISLNAYLKSGKTFPQARKEAAGSLLENPDILDSPNNILAIEYLKALQENEAKSNTAITDEEIVGKIEWIALETKNGNQRKVLKPGDAPVADFALLPGDEVISCLAYCNLHGLWKA